MVEGFIDAPEVINIDQQQGCMPAGGGAVFEQPAEQLAQRAAIEQPGLFVEHRTALQRGFLGLACLDVDDMLGLIEKTLAERRLRRRGGTVLAKLS